MLKPLNIAQHDGFRHSLGSLRIKRGFIYLAGFIVYRLVVMKEDIQIRYILYVKLEVG